MALAHCCPICIKAGLRREDGHGNRAGIVWMSDSSRPRRVRWCPRCKEWIIPIVLLDEHREYFKTEIERWQTSGRGGAK